MAFPYVCEACLKGDHFACEHRKGSGYGTGFCVCGGASHEPWKEKFAASIWNQYQEDENE